VVLAVLVVLVRVDRRRAYRLDDSEFQLEFVQALSALSGEEAG